MFLKTNLSLTTIEWITIPNVFLKFVSRSSDLVTISLELITNNTQNGL